MSPDVPTSALAREKGRVGGAAAGEREKCAACGEETDESRLAHVSGQEETGS